MASEVSERDSYWMRRALTLAALGEGLTRPNPPVGAVIVRDDRLVGSGWHRVAGGPHAERIALENAGRGAHGATLYLTLEPCSTWGRTPPCTEAILEAGIQRVVAACADPNPRHQGRGFAFLRRRGVAVTVGVERQSALELIGGFTKWIRDGRPWITLKLAMSIDGRVADASGQSRWITSPASRRMVQAERRRVDAIMVGVGTVQTDNPRLAPRPAYGRAPWRVIVDTCGRTPADARVLTDALIERTLVLVGETCDVARRRRLERSGATVESVPIDRQTGRVDLRAVIHVLARRGILRVLCEGGATLAGALVRWGLVDELLLMYAPRIIGADGLAAIGGAAWRLAETPRFRVAAQGVCGVDLWIRLRPIGQRRQTCSPVSSSVGAEL